MLLYRLAPDGLYAVADNGAARALYSDPFTVPTGDWRLGRPVDLDAAVLLPPLVPGKIVGVGRSYAAHARELDNPVPREPVLFLKAPSSVIGPGVPVVLPPESARVEYEGEIAIVVGRRLCRADAREAAAAVLGVSAACDVTARDLQRSDATFARAKSFDTFCPLGPAVWVGAPLGELTVATRINGEERQRADVSEMLFPIAEQLAYASRMMTLEPGDLLLTGTPSGTAQLADGDRIEVEVGGAQGPRLVLANPVETWRREP